MAKAAQHASIASESIIESKQETIERTKCKLHKCSKCGKNYSRKETLVRHFRLHSIELLCQYCKKVFFSEVKRSSHIRNNHIPLSQKEKRHVCKVCDKKFVSSTRLKIHMTTHTREKPYTCSFCKKTFKYSSSCKQHERTHTKTSESTYACSFCEKTFKYSSSCKQHERTHTKTSESTYAYSFCEKIFPYTSTCKRHERIHIGEKPYACSICQKTFQTLTNCRAHKQSIHNVKIPYACSICQRTFQYISSYERHKLVHTGEKPYSCSVCQKTFQTLNNCKQHEQTHSGKKSYACSICSKSFYYHSSWKKHKRIHAGISPYICKTCGEVFNSLSNLQHHVSIHTKKSSYKCGTGFGQSGANQHQITEIATMKNHYKCEKHILPVEAHSSRVSYVKRQIMLTPTNANSVHLLSDCDHFDNDPMADPDDDTLKAQDECEQDKAIAVGDVQLDTEEILEQNEISQLKNMNTGNVSILRKFDGSEVNFQNVNKDNGNLLLPVDVATHERKKGNSNITVRKSVSDQNKNSNDSEELLIQTDETSSGQAQNSTMDSLMNSFVSVAKLHGVVLHMSVAAGEEILNLENENQSNSSMDMGNPLSPMDIAKVRQMVSEENKLKLKKAITHDSTVKKMDNCQNQKSRYPKNLLIPTDKTSSNRAQNGNRDTTTDSLVKALVSAAKLQGVVLHVYCVK